MICSGPADPRSPNTRLDKENALPSSVRVIHTSEEVPASVFEPSLESEKAEITEIMNRKKARDGKLMARSDSDASSNSSYANRLPSLKYNESAHRYRQALMIFSLVQFSAIDDPLLPCKL